MPFNYGIELNEYIEKVDALLKKLFYRSISVQTFLLQISELGNISAIETKILNQNELIKAFANFIKKEYKRNFQDNINGLKPSIKSIQINYPYMINKINNTDFPLKYKKILEIIYFASFTDNGLNCEINKANKTKEDMIKNYLIGETKEFIEENSLKDKKIYDFVKLNHLLFYCDNKDHYLSLQFFLIINDYIYEKYYEFSNYDDYLLNLYYVYYKYLKPKNFSKLKEEIISKIDSYDYSELSFSQTVLNAKYIEKLKIDLENLKLNNKYFKLKIDEDLFNNSTLIKLFNIEKPLDKSKIVKYFRFSIIQENYSKYYNNKNKEFEFELSIDDLNYNDNKLHAFNIFFLISCGLIDRIEKDSLQIFNEDNNVIKLFQKYGIILLENINKIIFDIKNPIKKITNYSNITKNKENFGFGKIFNTFYVLYTNLKDNKYEQEKLKFDLADNLVQKNNNNNKEVININIKLNKSEIDSNFTIHSEGEDSNKSLNPTQKYHEKVNSTSLEDVCKTYIFSKINDLINNNPNKIQLIEPYKLLFGLNFFLPYIDENYVLKFIPIIKKLNNNNIKNNKEYGFQEFDCMFKVLGNEDIPMNQKTLGNSALPFVKCLEIKINSFIQNGQIQYEVNIENEKEFLIKKNALVLVENKIRFPQKKEKIIEYFSVMLKKLNFIIKLIKNTTKKFKEFQNIQLLLIYDDIIFDSDELKKYISIDNIKAILTNIYFRERVKFSVEIIYISQAVNIFNISKSVQDMNDMKKNMNDMKKNMNDMKKNMNHMKKK